MNKTSFGFLFLVLVLACSSFAQVSGAESGVGSGTDAISAIKTIDTSQLLALLKQHQGEPLVVNYWATWCGPCIEEMPDLVKFYHDWHERGIQFLSVSADHPDDIASRVKPYMQRMKIPFPVYVVGAEPPNKFIQAVDKQWQGSLPATFIYSATGEMLKRWHEKIELNDLESAVQSLAVQSTNKKAK